MSKFQQKIRIISYSYLQASKILTEATCKLITPNSFVKKNIDALDTGFSLVEWDGPRPPGARAVEMVPAYWCDYNDDEDIIFTCQYPFCRGSDFVELHHRFERWDYKWPEYRIDVKDYECKCYFFRPDHPPPSILTLKLLFFPKKVYVIDARP